MNDQMVWKDTEMLGYLPTPGYPCSSLLLVPMSAYQK